MRLDWFKGWKEEDPNSWWNKLSVWWNDHDSGARKWTKVNVDTLTVNTKATVPNGTVATDAAAFGQIKVIQTVFAHTNTTVTNTNSSTYSDALSVSITPTSASNKVLLWSCGTWRNSQSANILAVSTLRRGTTDLSDGSGFVQMNLGSNMDAFIGNSMCYLDSPATTSSTSYVISIKGNGATGIVQMPANSSTAVLIAMEVV